MDPIHLRHCGEGSRKLRPLLGGAPWGGGAVLKPCNLQVSTTAFFFRKGNRGEEGGKGGESANKALCTQQR